MTWNSMQAGQKATLTEKQGHLLDKGVTESQSFRMKYWPYATKKVRLPPPLYRDRRFSFIIPREKSKN